MLEAYRAARASRFVRRLLAALEAGDAAGGDRRGQAVRQPCASGATGAAYGGGLDIAVDLRVDDHAGAGRGARAARRPPLPLLLAVRSPARCSTSTPSSSARSPRRLAALGYEPEAGFEEAFARWVGTENFEERDVPGKIDPLVLEHLRRQAAAAAVA